MFITNQGEILSQGTDQLKAHLQTFGIIPGLQEFAIKSMGYAIVSNRFGALHVRFRPATLSDLALIRVIELIEDSDAAIIVVTFYDDATNTWHSRLHRQSDLAVAHVADQIMSSLAMRNRRVLIDNLPVDYRQEDQAFSKAFAFWWSLPDASTNHAALREFAAEAFHDRYALFRLDTANGVILEDVGAAKPEVARRALVAMISRPVHLQPDVWFGRSCSDAFLTAIHNRKACVQAVDALVDWPGHREARHRYRRILLPFSIDDTEWLLSGSVEDLGVDLRRHVA